MRTSTLAGAALVAALAGTLLTGCDDDATTEAHDYRISTPISRLSVRVDTGDVEGTGLISHDVRASTETGDVRLHLLAAPDSVRGTAATGDVWITVPAGHPYRVDAGTDTGSTHVGVPDTPSAPSAITAHTNTGSVRVTTA
jgi:DUF4097 and DUF4098 domain-containing protein YvlB